MQAKIIHRALCGSRLWKLNRPDSDYDYRQVVVTPLRELLYLDAKPKHNLGEHNDVTTYEFSHFLKFLEGGNPTMLETYFSPTEQTFMPKFNPYRVIDFDRMVASAKGLAKSQLKQLSKYTDDVRRGKAIVSGLTGLYLVDMVSQQEGWIPPDKGTLAIWKSIRNGDNTLKGISMLEEYLDKDYEVHRWTNYSQDKEYIKDILYTTYTRYDELGNLDDDD